MNTAINCIELILFFIQSINWRWKLKSHNRQPNHDLPQACGENKSICMIWLLPTENLQPHPKTSFNINESWSIKCKIHRSKINKGSIGTCTWRRFYINKKSNWSQQDLKPNWHPRHNLPQACRAIKLVHPIYTCHTENFQSHPRTSISINEHLPDQNKQTNKK